MPAHELSNDPRAAAEKTPAYCVVGTYSDTTGGGFVRHVAILADETDLRYDQPASVWHMGPPLVAGEESKKTPRAQPQCVVHLAGCIPLDLDEIEGIRDWLADVEKESAPKNPFKRYVVTPHCAWYFAPETGRPLYRRFSCTGFVLECYRSIGVDLVDTQEAHLPEIDFSMLVQAYPEVERERALARLGLTRDDLGIPGNGPWRIILAGYVFHALARVTGENPRPAAYQPGSVANTYFP